MRNLLNCFAVLIVVGGLGLGFAMIDLNQAMARAGLIRPEATPPPTREVPGSMAPELAPTDQQRRALSANVMRRCGDRQRGFAQADSVALDRAMVEAHCIRAADAAIEGRDEEVRRIIETPVQRRAFN